MKRIIIISLILLSTLALASCNMHRFKHGGHHGGHFSAHMIEKISDKLDLNEAQKADLEGISKEWKEKRLARKGEHVADMNAMIAEVKKEKMDKNVIDQLHKKKISHMQEGATFFTEKFIAFHQTLSPEQKEKLAVLLTEKMEKHKKYFQK